MAVTPAADFSQSRRDRLEGAFDDWFIRAPLRFEGARPARPTLRIASATIGN